MMNFTHAPEGEASRSKTLPSPATRTAPTCRAHIAGNWGRNNYAPSFSQYYLTKTGSIVYVGNVRKDTMRQWWNW
jgi:hypothetical protein